MLKREYLNNVPRLYKIMSDKYAFVSDASKKGSVFTIAIIKIGWIKPVYLIVNNEPPILAEYITDGKLSDDYNNEYCIFHAYYPFSEPCEKVEVHWKFNIEWLTCSTHSIYLKVLK